MPPLNATSRVGSTRNPDGSRTTIPTSLKVDAPVSTRRYRGIPTPFTDIDAFSRDPLASSSTSSISAIYVPTLGQHRRIRRITSLCEAAGLVVYILIMDWELRNADLNLLSGLPVVVISTSTFNAYLDTYASCSNPSLDISQSFSIPVKRTYALHHARMLDHSTIGLVDDDIEVTPGILRCAARCLDHGYAIAGCFPLFAPDISTVDHVATQLTAIPPPVSISGSCLFLAPSRTSGFFPYCYNEDWLFLLANAAQGSRIASLGSVVQDWKASWTNVERGYNLNSSVTL